MSGGFFPMYPSEIYDHRDAKCFPSYPDGHEVRDNDIVLPNYPPPGHYDGAPSKRKPYLSTAGKRSKRKRGMIEEYAISSDESSDELCELSELPEESHGVDIDVIISLRSRRISSTRRIRDLKKQLRELIQEMVKLNKKIRRLKRKCDKKKSVKENSGTDDVENSKEVKQQHDNAKKKARLFSNEEIIDNEEEIKDVDVRKEFKIAETVGDCEKIKFCVKREEKEKDEESNSGSGDQAEVCLRGESDDICCENKEVVRDERDDFGRADKLEKDDEFEDEKNSGDSISLYLESEDTLSADEEYLDSDYESLSADEIEDCVSEEY